MSKKTGAERGPEIQGEYVIWQGCVRCGARQGAGRWGLRVPLPAEGSFLLGWGPVKQMEMTTASPAQVASLDAGGKLDFPGQEAM